MRHRFGVLSVVVARELANLTVVVAREPVHFAVGFHQFDYELALLGLRRLHLDLTLMLHLIAAAELLGEAARKPPQRP